MREWIDDVVVLRTGRFREFDIWLRALCRRHGLLTLFAFGGSRSRRRFCGCLDTLNTLHCRVRRGGRAGYYNLEEATLLSGPAGLRGNWQHMGMAANCLRFVEAIGIDESGAGRAFELVEDIRALLESGTDLPPLLPQCFRMALAATQGFAVNPSRCGICGAVLGGSAFFVVEDGLLACPQCGAGSVPSARHAVPLSGSGLFFLQSVQASLPSEWPKTALSGNDRRSLAISIDGFVRYHLGLAWEDGHFRRV